MRSMASMSCTVTCTCTRRGTTRRPPGRAFCSPGGWGTWRSRRSMRGSSMSPNSCRLAVGSCGRGPHEVRGSPCNAGSGEGAFGFVFMGAIMQIVRALSAHPRSAHLVVCGAYALVRGAHLFVGACFVAQSLEIGVPVYCVPGRCASLRVRLLLPGKAGTHRVPAAVRRPLSCVRDCCSPTVVPRR